MGYKWQKAAPPLITMKCQVESKLGKLREEHACQKPKSSTIAK